MATVTEVLVQPLLPWFVMLPLTAAIITFLCRNSRINQWFSIAVALSLMILVALLYSSLTGMPQGVSEQRYMLGGWGAPLGIDLRVDSIALVMLALTAVLVLVLTFYSAAYITDEQQRLRFWPLWWLLIGGLNALFLAADLFNIYVTLEIIGLASVALVALQGSSLALQAALRYLMVSLLGSLCYLLGVALLYRTYGVLDLALITDAAQGNMPTVAALVLISTGLVMKTALFPLHFWLPSAHSHALGPVSAILSALVVKASFYLLAKFWLINLAEVTSSQGLQLLGVLGAGAILWGSIQAVRAQRLKLMVAYSTVAQIGYLFVFFPILSSPYGDNLGTAAFAAMFYFIIAHAVAKAAMFLAVSNIMKVAGHDELRNLKEVIPSQRLSIIAFAIAGASLIGLPPSGGFVAKWLLLSETIMSGQWWWAVVILTGGLLASIYVFRVLNLAFTQTSKQNNSLEPATLPIRLPITLPICALVLSGLAILLGFGGTWFLEVMGDPTGDGPPVPVFGDNLAPHLSEAPGAALDAKP